MYQLSGRHIVVDGVPTIYSYGLGSRATVAGAGSADSYSVDTWALPQVNFYLYDQSGTTLASLETDFYGGTYIDVSVTSGTTTLSSSASTVYVNDIYSANYGSTEAALYLPTRMKPFPDGQDGVDFLVTVQTPKTFLVSSDRPVNIASRSAISSNLQAEGRP
jgi:hypothetical protein